MRAAGHQDDTLPRATQHHPEQAAFVLQPGAIAIRLGDEPVERVEIEHRLGPRQAREVALDRADDDHGVELTARGSVGRQDLHGVGVAAFPRREARTAFAGVHRREERLDRGIGGRPRFRDRAREGDDGVELAPRLDGGVASVDQAARARQLTPQGGERIEHRTVRVLRRAIENASYLLHLRGFLRGQAVGELEGPRHGARPGVRDPQEAARRRR